MAVWQSCSQSHSRALFCEHQVLLRPLGVLQGALQPRAWTQARAAWTRRIRSDAPNSDVSAPSRSRTPVRWRRPLNRAGCVFKELFYQPRRRGARLRSEVADSIDEKARNGVSAPNRSGTPVRWWRPLNSFDPNPGRLCVQELRVFSAASSMRDAAGVSRAASRRPMSVAQMLRTSCGVISEHQRPLSGTSIQRRCRTVRMVRPKLPHVRSSSLRPANTTHPRSSRKTIGWAQ